MFPVWKHKFASQKLMFSDRKQNLFKVEKKYKRDETEICSSYPLWLDLRIGTDESEELSGNGKGCDRGYGLCADEGTG